MSSTNIVKALSLASSRLATLVRNVEKGNVFDHGFMNAIWMVCGMESSNHRVTFEYREIIRSIAQRTNIAFLFVLH